MAIPTLTSPPVVPNKYGGDTDTFNTAMQNRMNWQEVETAEKQQLATWLNTRNTAVDGAYDQAIQLGTLVSTANAAAVSAKASLDAAINTWNAVSTSVVLPSTTGDIHLGTIVKSIIYDTSKDSDGGAWRKRCTDKSWYNETIYQSSTWVGQQASVAAAWALGGLAMFQASTTTGPITAGKFYIATSSTGVTEVFRGIGREFPAVVAIVAEAGRVVIYDLTVSSCPMWMVITATVFSTWPTASALGSSSAVTLTAAAAANAVLCIGQNSGNDGGLVSFRFASDTVVKQIASSTYGGLFLGGIANRVQNKGFAGNSVSTLTGFGALVNGVVNDVAITVLDTAPIDPATGLPVPTIAVACGAGAAGGVSVIRHDGQVFSFTASDSNYTNFRKVAFTTTGLIRAVASFQGLADDTFVYDFPVLSANIAHTYGTSPAGGAFYRMNSTPPILKPSNADSILLGLQINREAITHNTGITLLKANPATPTKGMVSYITNAYNSGWQVGDSRGAYLADTTAETITASGELVTNGTFATTTTGWTLGNSATLSVVSGKLRLTNTAALNGLAYQAITTEVGRTYLAYAEQTAGTNSSWFFYAGTIAGGNQLGTNSGPLSSVTSSTFTFVATSTTSYISVLLNATNGHYADFDNISVKLADSDRSVKNTGLVLNGTLTKTAVASGAGLVAYSGFSASNYLEQPYSANLDFGTGDFCVMGWVNPTSFAVWQTIVIRGGLDSYTSPFIKIELSNTGAVIAACQSSNILPISSATITLNAWSFVSLIRISGILTLSINGGIAATQLNTVNLTNTAALLRFGRNLGDAQAAYGSNVALWRISATTPSADQISHIYRTELPLFQPNAQCTIAGTSTAVTALAYDDVADTLHVGTSWGRTSFRDLLRVDSEATTVGSITTLSANEGVVLTGGASSGKVYAPAMYLRDELRRKEIARKALGRVPAFFDYTATASQTAFVAPKGFTIKALYKNGTLMRETTTGVYWTRSNDGFQETATLSVGATVSDWISLMCVRN